MDILDMVQSKVEEDQRISPDEALALMESHDLLRLGRIASIRRQAKNGNLAYFIVNRHINHTNICVNRCAFCAFSRDEKDPDAYTMDLSEVIKRAELGAADLAAIAVVADGAIAAVTILA